MLLNCHTWFSLKYGAISPEELLKELSAKGYPEFALTDINNTSASLDFIRLAKRFDIRPILGIDFRNGIDQKFIALAKNNSAFHQLNEFLTKQLLYKIKFNDEAPEIENTFIIYPFKRKKFSKLKENEFVGIKSSELAKLPFSEWRFHLNKLVILQPISFRNKRDYNIHRLLRAIDNNTLLSQLPLSEQTSSDEMVISKPDLETAFENYPEVIQNTKKILAECLVEFDFKTNKNKQLFTNSKDEDYKLLRRECEKGLKYRFAKHDKTVVERMEKELKLIIDLGYTSYFLINWDIVKYARSKDFPYVGRGVAQIVWLLICCGLQMLTPLNSTYISSGLSILSEQTRPISISIFRGPTAMILPTTFLINMVGTKPRCLVLTLLSIKNLLSAKLEKYLVCLPMKLPACRKILFRKKTTNMESGLFVTVS